MTAISLMAECKKALPDAQVFVLIDGRYKRIDSVVLSGVDPVVTGLTSVCLDGEEYYSAEAIHRMLASLTDVGVVSVSFTIDGATEMMRSAVRR